MALPYERWLQTLWGRTDWVSWQFKTLEGESLRVLSPGVWNPNQGPDFIGAQIFIGQVLWVGAIELHVRSSDWFSHQHAVDPNYHPVVLHVVWTMDKLQPDLPTLVLSNYVSTGFLRQVLDLHTDIAQLPCQHIIRPVTAHAWDAWRRDLVMQRIANKWERFGDIQPGRLRRVVARQLGAWVNRDVFESIDASISDVLFEQVRSNLDWITALYVGQGGLLNDTNQSTYTGYLFDIYSQIRHGFQLNPPYRQLLWMRIRPAANPMVRLAQLAALLHAGWVDLNRWSSSDPNQIRTHLRSVNFHEGCIEWLRSRSAEVPLHTNISEGLADGLLVNIWAYLKSPDPLITADRLRHFAYEDNRVTRLYSALDLHHPTALDSQALLELHATSCVLQRCRSCGLARCWTQDQLPQLT